MRERLQQAFFAWGWLLPAYVPFFCLLGRAVFTILGTIYYVWAALSLYGYRAPPQTPWDRRLALSYFGLLLAGILSVVLAPSEPLHALWAWANLLVFSLTAWIGALILQTHPHKLDGLLRAWAIGGVATLTGLIISLAIHLQQSDFDFTRHLREDDLPLFMPFLLYSLHTSGWRFRRSLALALLVLITAYIVLSHGRAALLGLVVGLLAYAILTLNWRPRRALVASTVLLVCAITLSGASFWRGSHHNTALLDAIDVATTGRSVLWRQALAHPPANAFTGAGMGNLRFADPAVLTLHLKNPDITTTVKHLHNFLFDAWYETGALGLAALLIWLAALYHRGFSAWRHASPHVRAQLGVLLAAALAISTSALFSYSYCSREFAIYMYLFLLSASCYAQVGSRKSA